MIVWVSSFPRSGNTFLRIVLHRLYGIRTSVVYDVDGVAVRVGTDLVGHEDRPAPYAAMRESRAVHFVKTHRQNDEQVHKTDSAICLVRDGRDALVSWARQASENDQERFEAELRERILRDNACGTGSWGRNVLSWLEPVRANRVVLSYDDLVAAPADAVRATMTALFSDHAPVARCAAIPTFDELHAVDPLFFRRGRTGSYRDEFPGHLHDMFWSRPDNVAALRLLGIADAPPPISLADRSDHISSLSL